MHWQLCCSPILISIQEEPWLQQLEYGRLVGGEEVILLRLLCLMNSVPPAFEQRVSIIPLGKLLD